MSRLSKLLLLVALTGPNVSNLATDQSNPDKVIMLDLHDIILDFSVQQALTGFWRIPKKIKFLKSVKKYFKAKKSGDHSAIEKFTLHNSPSQEHSTAVLQAINPHQPNPDMIKLIQRLKNNGIKVYICSNIGERSYQELIKRYPDLFNLIDGCICSRSQDGYPKKDKPQFWAQVPELIPAAITKIPFVDNKQKNLDIAQVMCPRIQGILFKDAKQLEAELVKCELLPVPVSI